MRVVGRDYIFKLLNQDYFESVFDIRKKYFAYGEPQELGRNSTIFFVMKNPVVQEYETVGSGRPVFVRRVNSTDRDENSFSEEHSWHIVIELNDLQKFKKRIPAPQIFSSETRKKIHTQRPFGIELSPTESREIKEKINRFLQEV